MTTEGPPEAGGPAVGPEGVFGGESECGEREEGGLGGQAEVGDVMVWW